MMQTISNNMPINNKMTPENFVYWLQGLLELSPDLKTLNEAQVKMIREHLHYVFNGKQSASSFYTLATPYIAPTDGTTSRTSSIGSIASLDKLPEGSFTC